MTPQKIQHLLEAVQSGELAVGAAMERLRGLPFESLGFATVDQHRALRCGHGEVIYCPGKTAEQVTAIAQSLAARGHAVLGTRADPQQQRAVKEAIPQAQIDAVSRTILISPPPIKNPASPPVAVVCAGTTDLPVAEESAMTLRYMGVPTVRLNDCGVSGLHRLLGQLEVLQGACAVVVLAGMEGALPSVVGGLVDCPVFAVPTSVGYGASFGGLAALLGMLNSCASSICCVNIDNGFGAAYCAGLVYHQVSKARG